jgi:CubicO group peptidase (beta-lactamase class C family)
MKRKLLFTLAFLLPFLSAFAQSIPPPDFQQKMENLISSFTSNRSFNGCLLVANSNNIILRKCYGYADNDKKIKNTPNTFFKIASVTKEYTAIAIEIMQKKGLINKEDPINKYFKDFPKGNQITIQHLLDHRSGISDINDLPMYDSMAGREKDYSTRELYDIIKTLPFVFEPGSAEKYCNANYTLLAYLIELVSGMRYEAFLKENIFAPLHLSNTFIDLGNRRSALGYTADESSDGLRKISGWNSTIKLGNGCLSSNIDDVYLFLKELTKGKLADMAGIPENQNITNLQGSSPGFNAMARYQKDIDLYTVVLSNNWAWAGWSLAKAVSEIYQNKPYTIWNSGSKKTTPTDVAQWVGNHKAGNFSFNFRLKGDKPVISGLSKNGNIDYNRTYVITPLGNNEFFVPFFWAKIVFSSTDGQSMVQWIDIR